MKKFLINIVGKKNYNTIVRGNGWIFAYISTIPFIIWILGKLFEFLSIKSLINKIEIGSLVSILIGFLIYICSKYSSNPFKDSKNSIRMAIFFDSETKKENQRIENDFIIKLKKSLKKIENFEIQRFEVEDYRKLLDEVEEIGASESLKNSRKKSYIEKFCADFNVTYILSGKICTRNDNNIKNYIIKLEFGAKHKFIPEEICKNFSIDMGMVLQKDFKFPIKNEIQGFEFYLNKTDIAIQYIFGCVYYINGYLKKSFEIHFALYKDILKKNNILDQKIKKLW